ncbi:MAG: non-ribosomal peptide synthetase, partial [Phenylobacterium sp.]
MSVGHAALPAFVEWQRSTFGVSPDDRVSMLSGLSHDPIMRDIFLPLSCGAALLVPDEQTMHDARSLWAWLAAEAPTIIHATPPLGRLLCAVTDGNPALPGLRYVFWGGDMLTRDIVEMFQAANPALQQVNFYGATETPQAVAYHLCGPDDRLRRALPIGKATGPARIGVIDAQQRHLATNEVGEILVETPYLVVTDADSPGAGGDEGGQRYRSGDRGYLLPDQSVMLIGRADDQVKIRGYRVELADVARHIRALDEVADAVVLVGAAPDGEPHLIAHVVPRDAAQPDIGAAVRQRTARSLPSYMTPAQVIAHARLPLLPNGKIDRAVLREAGAPQEGSDGDGRKTARPFNAGERRIAGVFADLLGRPVDSPEQTFADLGADSLNSVHAMLRLEAMIPALPDDWHALSVAELAALLPTTDPRPPRRAGDLFRSVRVDPAVVLRAAAIVLIVAFHYKLLSVGGGLT